VRAHPELADRVRQLVEESGWPPDRLHLEITEGTIMRVPEAGIETLQQLRQLGIRLDMDDFGNGFSAFSSLHRFPLDTLNIDRAFIASMSERRDSIAVVQAVMALAQNLGMSVIAEGVETEEHIVQLQAIDADIAQGFAFSRPVSSEQLPATLKRSAVALPTSAAG
jgi:EAL domain-containing protein (putative c-di-GMP-specific phosphodiesterase class I)